MTKVQRYHDRVRSLGCILCKALGWGDTPAQLHHIFDTADRDDWLVIPLCREHHQGSDGFHGLGERTFNRVYRTSETKLLAQTLRELA